MRALLLLNLAACDVVWGLSGEPDPCTLARFDDAEPSDMMIPNTSVSLSGQAESAVFHIDGKRFEQSLAGGDPVELSVSIYPPLAVALAPEGALLLHSSALEPPLLELAERREDGVWVASARTPPKGVIAGVPSAVDFGARRVMVQLKASQFEDVANFQEYEETGTGWIAVGDPVLLTALQPPNLTPSGLTMVFTDSIGTGHAVFAANRNSTEEPFGEPRELLVSDVRTTDAQLIGKQCATLFVNENGSLRRRDR